jgi:hypothetical protein
VRRTWLAAITVLAGLWAVGAQASDLRAAKWDGATVARGAIGDQLIYSGDTGARPTLIVDSTTAIHNDAATNLHGAWRFSTEYLYHPCVDCKSVVLPPRLPKGFMIYSPGGRMMVILEYPPAAAPNKKGPVEQPPKRGVFFVYSGKYTVDTSTIVVAVDLTSSSREDPHELVYGYRVDGDLLTMTMSPSEPSKRPSEWKSSNLNRSVWLREQPGGGH